MDKNRAKQLLIDKAQAVSRAVDLARRAGPPAPKAPRTGILLVTFGTSVAAARVAFDHVGAEFARDFGDLPLRWGMTSPIVRHKLKNEGQEFESTSLALARMLDEGFSHVAVQSLHTIPGVEYRQLLAQVRAFAAIPGGFTRVSVGKPLLADEGDLALAAEAVLRCLPPGRTREEAVVLMGHGTWHPGKAFYGAIDKKLRGMDPGVFVGAMEGSVAVEAIRDKLLARGVRTVWLAPFMSVAGEHAVNDMAGERIDSWKNILSAAGLEVRPVLKGTAEFKDFVHIWAAHLRAALEELLSPSPQPIG